MGNVDEFAFSINEFASIVWLLVASDKIFMTVSILHTNPMPSASNLSLPPVTVSITKTLGN